MEPQRLLVVLACVAALSAGCESTMDPIQVVPKCPDQPVRGPLEYASAPAGQTIDDFETGSIYLPQVQGRTGFWWLANDQTTVLLSADVSADCAARGRFAGHFVAYDSLYWNSSWTAVFVATPNNLTASPYDARAYSGISFWAGLGGYNGPASEVPIGITTMDNAWNSTAICRNKCGDYYQAKVSLTRHWQRYVVRFDEMAQEGWGDPLVPMRKDQLVGFIIWPRQQFDIWIDDLRFEP